MTVHVTFVGAAVLGEPWVEVRRVGFLRWEWRAWYGGEPDGSGRLEDAGEARTRWGASRAAWRVVMRYDRARWRLA